MTILSAVGRGAAVVAPWLLLLGYPFLVMVWVMGLTTYQPPRFLVGVMTTGLVSVGAYGLVMLLLALAGLLAWITGGWPRLDVSQLALWAMGLFLLVQAGCFAAAFALF